MFSLDLVKQVYAAVPQDTLLAGNEIGNVGSITGLFVWMFNLLRFIGWAGVIVGIGWVIVLLIYKLFNTESEEAAKTVQQGITHAVIIIIAGILLVSAGFLVTQVMGLFGTGIGGTSVATFGIPSALGGDGSGSGGTRVPPSED